MTALQARVHDDAQSGDILIGLGANLPGAFGSPQAAIRRAIGELALMLGQERLGHERLGQEGRGGWARASSLWASPAWPLGAGPDYVNAALALPMGEGLSPEGLLSTLHDCEARAGRVRGLRWAPRALDLDLLAVGDAVAPDPATQSRWRAARLGGAAGGEGEAAEAPPDRLILPHPRLQERAFVLAPLAEVAPGWRHPLTGETVAGMWAALPAAERAAVRRLG